MNPLNLSGPDFLVFYAFCGAAICGGLYLIHWVSEPYTPTGPVPTDPQTIAYLRGGLTETLRIAVVTLLEREVLLLGAGDTLRVNANHTLPLNASSIDRALCDHFAAESEALSLFKDDTLIASARAHAQPGLEKIGLLPDETLRDARQRWFLAAAVTLGLLAALKVTVAFERGHTAVVLLVMEAVLFCGIAHSVTHRFRTPAGDRALNYWMHSFESLRHRTNSMAHPAPADVALVAAVFGLAGLPEVSSANVKVLQPRPDGGGCGGGCGSGGGDGCGGCGCD